jgi:IS605 OrfB family transposase
MNNIKINKCIKVTLKKCLNMDIKEIKRIIKEANLASCKASNKAIRMWLQFGEQEKNMIDDDILINKELYEKEVDDTYNSQNTKTKKHRNYFIKKIYNEHERIIKNKFNDKIKEKYGVTLANVIEPYMKNIMNLYSTSNVATLHQQSVQGAWNRLKEKVLNCEANISSFKLDTPYFIHGKNYKLYNNGGWFVDIAFFSREGLKEYGLKTGHKFEFEIDTMDNNKKSTITKIINGEYKQGSAQISISKKGKIELIISFGFEKEIDKPLDKSRILGIDLGIVKVATMSIWDENKLNWDWFSYKNNIVNGAELIAFRQKYYNLRRDMSICSKYVGDGREGHGYKTKMKPVNKVRDKVANFSDTYNHKISKYIVEFAVKNNCGTIQMEDLSGATSNTHEKFLKEWSYYDLQNKIEYKAKEQGIEIRKINPKYTSKRCSKCGNIHIENRDCKNDQAKFECKICGHKENADINASKNIAIPYIDEIIKNTTVQAS